MSTSLAPALSRSALVKATTAADKLVAACAPLRELHPEASEAALTARRAAWGALNAWDAAVKTLQGGYFQDPDPTRVYAKCPTCWAGVRTVLPYGERGAVATTRALVPVLAAHIIDLHS